MNDKQTDRHTDREHPPLQRGALLARRGRYLPLEASSRPPSCFWLPMDTEKILKEEGAEDEDEEGEERSKW